MDFKHEGESLPAGTQYLELVDSLIDVFKEKNISHVEVVFMDYKLDGMGKRIVEDGQHVIQIRPIGIKAINDQVREELKVAYNPKTLFSLLVLWIDRSVGKLGTLSLHPDIPGMPERKEGELQQWEQEATAYYLQRRVPKKT